MHAEHARSIELAPTYIYVCQRHFHYQCVYNARDYHFTIDPMHASANIPQNGPGFTKKMLPMRNLKFSTRFVIHRAAINLERLKSIAVLYGRACRKLLSTCNCNTFFVKWGPVPCFRSPIARWICHASIDTVYYCARELPCLQIIIVFILRIIISFTIMHAQCTKSSP